MRRAATRVATASIVVGLLISLWGGAAGASQHVWTRLSPVSTGGARAGHVMAFDPVSGFVVMFGGYDANGYRGDTELWDGTTWVERIPDDGPTPRAAPGMAYDRVTRQLVLFGGFDGTVHLGDTWTYDGSTLTWTHRTTATKPPGVSGPMLFTDPLTGHVDMFGGFDGALFQLDTWQWTGTDWRKLHPATSATARGAAIAELDRATHTVVMFSGLGDVNTYDTWTWDGATWTRRSPAHQPPARFYSSSAYDPDLRGVIVFGGASGFGDLADTWAWTGTDWRQLRVGRPPAKRESQAMAYDPATRNILMFGGQVRGAVADDTWSL